MKSDLLDFGIFRDIPKNYRVLFRIMLSDYSPVIFTINSKIMTIDKYLYFLQCQNKVDFRNYF